MLSFCLKKDPCAGKSSVLRKQVHLVLWEKHIIGRADSCCALAVCLNTKVTEIPQLKAQLSSLPPSHAVVKDSTDCHKFKLKKLGQGTLLPFLL